MAKLLDSFIVGILCAISMAIFKLDYIVLISVIVGITNMIPYIGPFIGGAIGMVLLLSTSPKNAIIFLIIILILQQFDGHILGPKILGGKVGVKPLWILVSLLIGGAFGGVMGMFLGTPIIAMILNLINKDIEKKLQKDGLLDKFKSNDEGLEKEQKD
jgi:predicted PurR-regulated permease PerM